MLIFCPISVSIPLSEMDGMANLIMILAPLGATCTRLLFVLSVKVSRTLRVLPIVLIIRDFTCFPVLIIEISITI